MSLKIENPQKRKKAERINKILRLLFSPFLSRTRKRKGRDLSKLKFRKILLIRPHHLGDFIMFTPALRAVRKRFPSSEIVLLAGSWAEPLVRYNPHVDRIIFHDCLWWRKIRPGKKPSFFRHLLDYTRLFFRLRQERFDLAIDFLGDLRNILLFMQMPGARYKIGFDRSGGEYFLTHPAPFDLPTHEVMKCFELLELLGIEKEPGNLEVFCSEREKKEAERIRENHGLEERRFLIIHPGARLKLKRWPEPRFASLAKKLAENTRLKIVVAGDRDDRRRMRPFELEQAGVINLCGELDLLTLKALMEKALLFIGNSSLGMHLAAAAGTPVVGVLGSADPRRTAPHGVPCRLVQKPFDCSPCLEIECPLSSDGYGACLKALSVEEVYSGAMDFLNKLRAKKQGSS